MERKIQLSNYFSSDDESCVDSLFGGPPGDLWEYEASGSADIRTCGSAIEGRAEAQVARRGATRQQFSPTDKKAIQMFGREEFRPVMEWHHHRLQVLAHFQSAS